MIVTRFAPSPTGPLHLGHVRAAFFAHDLARRLGGRFLLRIENIDAGRCRPEWEAAIGRDLAALGLRPDEAPLRQSERSAVYAAALAELSRRGLVYPCFCTRAAVAAEIAASATAPHGAAGTPRRDPDGAPLYPGTCRALPTDARRALLAAGAPHGWRLDMAAALGAGFGPLHRQALDGTATPCRPARFGDVVLGRRDAAASYHLASVLDDATSGVTLVTRGDDLAPAADLHRLLQALLGLPAPRYAFHPLMRAPDGRRLSKRDGAPAIAALLDAGATPDGLRAAAGIAELLDAALPPGMQHPAGSGAWPWRVAGGTGDGGGR